MAATHIRANIPTVEGALRRGWSSSYISLGKASAMAEAWRLYTHEGLANKTAVARAMGRSQGMVSRHLLWVPELSQHYYEALMAGTLTEASANDRYRAWWSALEEGESKRLQAGRDTARMLEDAAAAASARDADTSIVLAEGRVNVHGGDLPPVDDGVVQGGNFSFMSGPQLVIWKRALRAGAPLLVACDAAGIDRRAPLEWLGMAEAGSAEHCEFVRMSRSESASSYVKLAELVVKGRAGKVQYDYLTNGFRLFDDTSKDETANREVSALLSAAVGRIAEAARAARGLEEG